MEWKRLVSGVSLWGYTVFDAPGRTRKGVKKTCQWHVFSPWESPFPFQTRPVGVWMEWKRLVSGVSLWDTPFLILQAGLERAAAAQLPSYPAGWELKQQIKWEIMENTGIRLWPYSGILLQ